MTIKLETVILLLTLIIGMSCGSKVIELDERLPELIQHDPSRAWLIKFYAPWCHYCRNLEPTYDKVAETIYHRHDHLLVGRLDCSRYSSVCQSFDVKSFPTIKYLTTERRISYEGERMSDSIVNFAERLHGPYIRQIDDCKKLKELEQKHGIIFVSNIRDKTSSAWNDYQTLAQNLITSNWFYSISSDENCLGNQGKTEAVYILKFNQIFRPVFLHENKSESKLEELIEWARRNRLAYFARITSANINQALLTRKKLVLALVEEFVPLNKLHASSQKFIDMFLQTAREFNTGKDAIFQFGWSGDLETINSIAIKTINPIPNLIIINPDLTYHMIETNQTPTATEIRQLLKSILEQSESLKTFGGDSIYHRLMRMVYDTFATLARMYHGNPILTLVLIGIPCLFLSAILYTVCCYDGYSTEDEETEPLLINNNGNKRQKANHNKED